MKVAYIFMSDHAREILENMILPQMEAGVHGADVVGMVFFFDNAYMLHKDSEIGKRLAALSEKNGMMLVGCDYCCQQRGISNDLVSQQVWDASQPSILLWKAQNQIRLLLCNRIT